MSDIFEAVNMTLEFANLLEPVIRKNKLKKELERKGKSRDEAKVYILALDLLKSAYVDKLIIQDEAIQLAMPYFIDVVMDDDLARVWFKDQQKIQAVCRLLN